MLSVLLRYTDSDCPFGIFKLFFDYLESYPSIIISLSTQCNVFALLLDRSISAFQSISRNSEGHMESVQPIKCMIFILISNNICYYK